jgi:hypothetical protein
MDLSRRTFIFAAGTWAGFTLLSACSPGGNNAPRIENKPCAPPANDGEPAVKALDPTDKRGMLIGPGSRKKGTECWLAFVDLDRIEEYVAGELKATAITLAFSGHAVVPHPIERHKAGVFEKWGPGACEVDMREMKVLRPITTVPERQFYGHAAWALDGSVLYTVESTPPSAGPYEGVIAIRDGKTLEIIGEFPTYGKAPHDCHLLDGGRTLGVTNGGTPDGDPGCVTFMDIESRQLIERVTIPRLMAGHVAITGASSKGDLAVGSTPHNPPGADPEAFKKIPGGLALRSGSGDAVVMSAPEDITKQMLGETLSVVIHDERGIVGATTPAGNIVTFWDVKQGKLLKSYNLAMARGIALTLDRKHFVVTYGAETSMVMIRADDLSIVEESRFAPSALAGSHVIVYDL